MDAILDQYGVIGLVIAFVLVMFGIRLTTDLHHEWRRNLVIGLFLIAVIFLIWLVYLLLTSIGNLGFYYLIFNLWLLYKFQNEIFPIDQITDLEKGNIKDLFIIGLAFNLLPLFIYLVLNLWI